MPSDKDILGKADALLRRHSPPPPGSDADASGVPILTDIVKDSAQPAEAAPGDLAEEVFTRVMAEIEGRLVAELERRLAHHLASEVQAAVAGAMVDLHQDLTKAIGGAVAEALANRTPK